MEHRKEGNGVTCPEEGWKWYVSDRESSTYEEDSRHMELGIWRDSDWKVTTVIIQNKWFYRPERKHVLATPEERIMIYQRVQRAIEFLGLKCVVKFE